MPFTPSHAVVALPFVRTPLLPAAIAFGAMTPDLPLFLRGTPITYQATHTNVLLSSVIALVLLGLWYALLRPAVRELSPGWLAGRLPPEWDATGAAIWAAVRAPRADARASVWRGGAVFPVLVAVSLVLGVISHIAWDAFTHEGRWGTQLFPALDEQWGPLLGYKWAQYASSVLGLAVVLVYLALWLRRRAPQTSLDRLLPSAVRIAWWVSAPVILVGALIVGLVAYGPLTATWTAQHLAYRVLPPAVAVWGALTALSCVAIAVTRARRSRRGA